MRGLQVGTDWRRRRGIGRWWAGGRVAGRCAMPATVPRCRLGGPPTLPTPLAAPTGPNARVKVSAAKAQVSEATHGTANLWNLMCTNQRRTFFLLDQNVSIFICSFEGKVGQLYILTFEDLGLEFEMKYFGEALNYVIDPSQ